MGLKGFQTFIPHKQTSNSFQENKINETTATT